MIRGTCLCGDITFELTSAAGDMSHCHCSMCRKSHGSGFATYLFLPTNRFRWTRGEERVQSYESSPGAWRSFCPACGSTLPAIADSLAFVPAGLLVDECNTRPQAHIFAASRAPWTLLNDDLVRHDLFPPGYGFSNNAAQAERMPQQVPQQQFPQQQVQQQQAPQQQAPQQQGIIAGSCLCNRVRFEVQGEPLRMVNCHCSRCRYSRAAAHATNLFVSATSFRWIAGEEDVHTYKLPSARTFGTAFCRNCGSLLPRVNPAAAWVNIPSGCLDGDPGIRPSLHIYTAYRTPWFEITDALPQYAEAPPPSR